MMENKELIHKILETITRITSHAQKRVVTYDKTKLYPSEIHLLMSIHAGQDTNVTKIANHIGLTKGAISQTLARLKKKGIIDKNSDKQKKNELHITFTEKGEKIMQHIIEMRNSLISKYLNYVNLLNENDKQVISKFLDLLTGIINKRSS
ncbi:MAG: MarR family winged helix-turn-helix transcriptional regulator [Candidatus Odinarchaeota archaeon]